MALPRLRELDFGCAAAEAEFIKRPDLLLAGFLDEQKLIEKALNSERFLVLGNKGCGKSSIAKHLELRAQTDPNLFVTNLAIADLSYRTLRATISDDVEDRIRYPRVWAWLVLITMLAGARSDNGLTHPDMESFDRTARALRDHGLLPHNGISPSLTRLSEVGLHVFGQGVSVKTSREAGDISIHTINEVLKDQLSQASTESKHLLIIDGLDDVLLDNEGQLEAISALIYECAKINEFFCLATHLSSFLFCVEEIFFRVSPGRI